jgi:hypothetical protein
MGMRMKGGRETEMRMGVKGRRERYRVWCEGRWVGSDFD